MKDLISPRYRIDLINTISDTLFERFTKSKYENVLRYIKLWQKRLNNGTNNFEIKFQGNNYNPSDNINLQATLDNIEDDILIKIAIDLGLETPNFIPSVPIFRNELKCTYETAYATFINACNKVEEDPDLAIGLANSALESIIKEILKDITIPDNIKVSDNDTLYKLTESVLKVLELYPNGNHSTEHTKIGSSLLKINKIIETLRSEQTNFHGRASGDHIINDSTYAYFIINSVSTIGLFLHSLYKNKHPIIEREEINNDDIPF